MGDKYHRAARDGNLDMLREATRRDSNRPDEDGMTPTLWAAYTGNLWALRMLIGRGGNPDCCDLLGNTALHHCASKGHFNCAEYLISFGCNIWAVDNDHRSSFDLASLHDRLDIVKLLDNAISTQMSQNHKTAEKLKMKASAEAEKNQKRYEKLQEETKKRMERDEKRIIMQSTDTNDNPNKTSGGTISKVTKVFSTIRGKKDSVRSTGPKMYSQHFNGSQRQVKSERRVIETLDTKLKYSGNNGHMSVRSMPIIPHNVQVVYTNPSQNGETKDDHYNTGDSGIVSDDGSDYGVFTRPGFGNLSFLPKSFTADTLNSLPSDLDTLHDQNKRKSMSDVQSIDRRFSECNIEEEDYNANNESEFAAVETFLNAHHLGEFVSNFVEEKVDLEALMLLTDEDLMHMGLPLGPRRKLRDAITRNREVMERTNNIIEDTYL